MMALDWIDINRKNGNDKYSVKTPTAGQEAIHRYRVLILTLFDGMRNYDPRINKMNNAEYFLIYKSR